MQSAERRVPSPDESPKARDSQCFLAIDIESSGQDMTRHFLVAVGACVVQLESNSVHEPSEDQFLAYLAPPPGTGWDPACLEHFWNNPKKGDRGRTQLELLEAARRKHGLWEPHHAMDMFVHWLHRMALKYPLLIVVSDNPAYDVAWINYAVQRFATHPKPFDSLAYCTGEYRSIRDVTSFYRGVALQAPHAALGASGRAEEQALQRLGVPSFPEFGVLHDHNPLHDALLMAHQAVHVCQLLSREHRD